MVLAPLQRTRCGPLVSKRPGGVAAALILMLLPAVASASGTLRQARITIVVDTPYSCDVTAAYSIDAPNESEIEHRIQLFEGASVELIEITGAAQQIDSPKVIGRTQSISVRLAAAAPATYGVRYRVRQPADWAYRCPMWVPTTPTDGTSQPVAIDVELPPAARASGGGVPAFRWAEARGTAILGHVPAFVRVPYATEGGPAPPRSWDVARLMDLLAVAILAVGSALWVWTRKRR